MPQDSFPKINFQIGADYATVRRVWGNENRIAALPDARVVVSAGRPSELRSRIAEKLVEIALVGAGAIMALLYALAKG